jgi:hypothetical protein
MVIAAADDDLIFPANTSGKATDGLTTVFRLIIYSVESILSTSYVIS